MGVREICVFNLDEGYFNQIMDKWLFGFQAAF